MCNDAQMLLMRFKYGLLLQKELRVTHTLFTLHLQAVDRDAAVKEKQRLTDQLAKVSSGSEPRVAFQAMGGRDICSASTLPTMSHSSVAWRMRHSWSQVKNEHDSFDQHVEAIKRRVAGHAKERLLHEKKVKKLQADRDKRVREGVQQGIPHCSID